MSLRSAKKPRSWKRSSLRINGQATIVRQSGASGWELKGNRILGEEKDWQAYQFARGLVNLLYADDIPTAVIVRKGPRTGARPFQIHVAGVDKFRSDNSENDALDLSVHRGQWVALKGTSLLAAATTPKEVLDTLRERGLTADALFRVPIDPDAEQVPES